jgi:hypothetical protein
MPKQDAEALGREASPGEWSPCDEHCRHSGPVRLWIPAEPGDDEHWQYYLNAFSIGMVVRAGRRLEAQWRVLTVHHLDGDKSNCRWWNLLALCQVCHLYIQGKVIPERPWILEHSEWFKPYVAGFYAWYHASAEPTREQVEADLDSWLQLGQPWMAVGL